ncbi:hypothetical protein Pelo_8082 [Pelomyxa schiedti]|nr:hypothetical protein Pelo_8082 [Pelomyxa schiedti]
MEPLNVVDRTDEGNTQRHEKAPPRDVDVDVGGSSRDDDAGGDVSNTSSLCNSVGCHQSAQLLVPARVSARSSTVMCLVVNREWREMNGITHDEVCAACTTAECCSWRTQKEVECPQELLFVENALTGLCTFLIPATGACSDCKDIS